MDDISRPQRHEYKYFVPVAYRDALRDRFLRHMDYDEFCQRRDGCRYSVRSIYLDTMSRRFYYEKVHGLKVRKKVRIRCYNSRGECASAFLEIKHKINGTGYKERAQIPIEEMARFFDGTYAFDPDSVPLNGQRAAATKFAYLVTRFNLEPTVLVTYEREAFVGSDEPDLRVTFDMNTRSYAAPDMDDLFCEERLRIITDQWFILETKFAHCMPFWARLILKDFNLKRQAISKYCWGIDVWQSTEDILGPD